MKKFCMVWFAKDRLYNKTNIIITSCTNCPWTNEMFSGPFLPLAKIGGHTATKLGAIRPPNFFRPKIFFAVPFELFCILWVHKCRRWTPCLGPEIDCCEDLTTRFYVTSIVQILNYYNILKLFLSIWKIPKRNWSIWQLRFFKVVKYCN